MKDVLFANRTARPANPRDEAIDYRSYEGDTRHYTREAGDYMVSQFLELLNEVK